MEKYLDISVITTHYNCKKQLKNLLYGLEQNSLLPQEVIIINLGNTLSIKEKYAFPVKIVNLPFNSDKGLPFARARNLGALKAKNNKLFFVDVSCIPGKNFIKTLNAYTTHYSGIIMGTPKTLLQSVSLPFQTPTFAKISKQEPETPTINGIEQFFNYEYFSSLCFYIHKKQYNILEGFDEQYNGYGSEDTDLAFTARDHNCPFYICDATVYQQKNTTDFIPLQQLKNIVDNAQYFYDKWGKWPMEEILLDFKKLKLIDWKFNQNKPIKIISEPSQRLKERSLLKEQPLA